MARCAPRSSIATANREPSLEIAEAGRPWSFDGDGSLFRLVAEALVGGLLGREEGIEGRPPPGAPEGVRGEDAPVDEPDGEGAERSDIRVDAVEREGRGRTSLDQSHRREDVLRNEHEQVPVGEPAGLYK